MTAKPNDWRSVRLAEAIYRAAATLLPKPLRGAFADDAVEMFRDRAREARRGGRLAVAVTLARAVLDLALQAVSTRLPAPNSDRVERRLTLTRLAADLGRDTRQAIRQWRREPAFSIAALTTLMLGIGLTAAMFSVVHSVLLRPLPFVESNQLVMVWERNLERGWPRFTASPANFFDWTRTADLFDGLAAYSSSSATLLDGGEPIRVNSASVRWNLFGVVGTPPLLGRAFVESENAPGNDAVVILSHRIWANRFGEDAAVVGRIVTINDRPRQVVGVLPPGFGLLPQVDLWMPITFDFDVAGARGAHYLAVVARLAPGASVEQAQAQMDTVSNTLASTYADSNSGWDAVVVPMRAQLLGGVESPLWTLFGAVGLVLLIAAANVINLLLAQSGARRFELGVRRALGAGRGRILRQLTVESTLLAVVGSAGGLGIAWLLIRLMVALDPGGLPRTDAIEVNGWVVAFSGAVALAVGLVTGVLGALPVLKSRRRTGAEHRRGADRGAGRRTRHAVVVAEVAMALMLLTGWGLVAKSLVGLRDVATGFEPAGLVTARVSPPSSRYPEASLRADFYRRVTERLRAMPAIDQVGVATAVPLAGSTSYGFVLDREPLPPPSDWSSGQLRAVSLDYFETMGFHLLRGRPFQPTDQAGAPAVVVINETMARALSSTGDALGLRIQIASGDASCPCEVVGVVADVRETSLDQPPTPVYYLPEAQSIWTTRSIVVRSRAELSVVVALLRTAIADVDPGIALFDIQPVSQILDAELARPRFSAWVLGVFAALAVVLALGGIYGVTSVVVSQRVPELGIRAALGAGPAGLAWLVERDVLLTTSVGLAVGLAGAVLTTRFLADMLVGVSPLEPGVFIAAVVLLAGVGAMAALVPALRAGRTDPTRVLRQE